MRLPKMLSLKIAQNNEIQFYNRGMPQAKEDVAVTNITYLVNQLLAKSMSSYLQPQKKKRKKKRLFIGKTHIAQPYYRHCSKNRIITNKKLN